MKTYSSLTVFALWPASLYSPLPTVALWHIAYGPLRSMARAQSALYSPLPTVALWEEGLAICHRASETSEPSAIE